MMTYFSPGGGMAPLPPDLLLAFYALGKQMKMFWVSCLKMLLWLHCRSNGCYTAPISGTYKFSVQKYGNNKQGSFDVLLDNKQIIYTRHKDPSGSLILSNCSRNFWNFYFNSFQDNLIEEWYEHIVETLKGTQWILKCAGCFAVTDGDIV